MIYWSSVVVSSGLVLLHGAQADGLVLCHGPTRPHVRGLLDFKLPDRRACMAANLAAAQLTNPAARFVGIAVNTSQIDKGKAASYLKGLEDDFGLPAVDPFAGGVAPIVERLA